MRTVILGIGNTILSDEGAGVRAVEALEAAYDLPEGVEVIDGGTSGMELLGPLSGTDFLVILDAIKASRLPGTVVKLTGAEVPVFFRSKLSPHQISICDVLAGLEFSGDPPGDMVFIGVEPLSLELGLELTPVVAASIPDMLRLAIDELAARGVALRQKVAEVV
jgi:hydrogenase maturation protease